MAWGVRPWHSVCPSVCVQVAGEYGMVRVVSETEVLQGKDYCVLYNPQWAPLPHDLSKAVSTPGPDGPSLAQAFCPRNPEATKGWVILTEARLHVGYSFPLYANEDTCACVCARPAVRTRVLARCAPFVCSCVCVCVYSTLPLLVVSGCPLQPRSLGPPDGWGVGWGTHRTHAGRVLPQSLLRLHDWTSSLLCSPADLPADGFSNQLALVARGNCTFYEKVRLAQGGGAQGLLIVSREKLVRTRGHMVGGGLSSWVGQSGPG